MTGQGVGVYRWCSGAVFWKQQMHEEKDHSNVVQLGHLCVSVCSAGQYRGLQNGIELFRAGVANILVGQEFDDSLRLQVP